MKRLRLLLLLSLSLYVASYLAVRATHVEVRKQDGRPYVIIPASARWLYYLYRPMMYLDATTTGMRFHIGPHHVPAVR